MKNKAITIILLGTMFMIMLISLVYSEELSTVPRVEVKNGLTTNWAGYAVLTNLSDPMINSIQEINASWIVPKVDCKVVRNSYAAVWVGMDGYSSPSVEQIGTDSICSQGKPVYYAWYEMYPKNSVYLRMKVNQGDLIFADVKYLGKNKFKLTITNKNTKISYSTTQLGQKLKRTSAEWIIEAPSIGKRTTPLSNFSEITFMGSSVTINNITGPITSNNWQYDKMEMVNNYLEPKTTTSEISLDGKSFSVDWLTY